MGDLNANNMRVMTYDVTVMIRKRYGFMLFHTFRKAKHSFGWGTVLIKSDLMDLLNRKIADRSKASSSLISSNESNLTFKMPNTIGSIYKFYKCEHRVKVSNWQKVSIGLRKCGTDETTSPCLNQWWLIWLTRLCVIRPPGVYTF